jgi:ElaB/YqjD/DUF883 family membrane-anchored ribosome-binding protein
VGQRADDLARRDLVGTDEDDGLAESTLTAREDIESTRADLSSTIDAIQDCLDPEVLSEQAKETAHDVTDYAISEAKVAAREITDHAIEQAREAVQEITGQAKTALHDATIGKVETMARTASDTAGGWRQSVVETIKANPMPAALVGLGVGWMLLNRPTGSAASGHDYGTASGYGYGTRSWAAGAPAGRYGNQTVAQDTGRAGAASGAQEKVGRVADQAQQTATHAAQNVQDTANQVMDQVQQTSGQLVDQVQEQASRAQSFLSHQLDENPLLVGAVAVAIGGVLAGTVRSTHQEDQILGTARDKMMGSARELTQDTMQKVGCVVDEVQSTAKEEARQQSLIPDAHPQ